MVKFEDIDFRYLSAEFIMTNCCNLKCDYCFEQENVKPGWEPLSLDFDTVCGYMDLIIKNRIERNAVPEALSCINFFGGEPMLKWDVIKRVIEKYGDLGCFRFSIITNGLLVTKQIIDEMEKYKILWQFSIDSANPEGNRHRFKDKSKELTQHVLDMIEYAAKKTAVTPIVSMVITEQSVPYLLETYHYFAVRQVPVNLQIMLERINETNDEELIRDFKKQQDQILELLIKNPFNIPSLWNNVIQYVRRLKITGEPYKREPALTEGPTPNNLYIVGPNGKCYLSTNYLNSLDYGCERAFAVGGLPYGIDIEKVRNQFKLETTDKDFSYCEQCPSGIVNPCCIERNFFVYPHFF